MTEKHKITLMKNVIKYLYKVECYSAIASLDLGLLMNDNVLSKNEKLVKFIEDAKSLSDRCNNIEKMLELKLAEQRKNNEKIDTT